MPEWDAEREVDGALVQRVLADQFPELLVGDPRLLATGWDNSVWLVNDDLVFRFPRRAIALPGIEREIMVLPELAPRLPITIPAPTRVGRPGPHFPWPFVGAPFIHGGEPAAMQLDGRRAIIGVALGRFLLALHRPSILASWRDRLPHDPMARADMRRRVPLTAQRLDAVQSRGLWRVPAAAERILDDAVALPESDGLALVHGDLHVRHVLMDDAGEPTGIIDWGDACIGDPAIDLSLYWSLLDTEGRSAFAEAYGAITEVHLARARVIALFLNAALAVYAADIGNGALLAEAIGGLDRTVREGP